MLRVRTKPGGGELTLGFVPLGKAPTSKTLAPGTYWISATWKGGFEALKEVKVLPGIETVVVLKSGAKKPSQSKTSLRNLGAPEWFVRPEGQAKQDLFVGIAEGANPTQTWNIAFARAMLLVANKEGEERVKAKARLKKKGKSEGKEDATDTGEIHQTRGVLKDHWIGPGMCGVMIQRGGQKVSANSTAVGTGAFHDQMPLAEQQAGASLSAIISALVQLAVAGPGATVWGMDYSAAGRTPENLDYVERRFSEELIVNTAFFKSKDILRIKRLFKYFCNRPSHPVLS